MADRSTLALVALALLVGAVVGPTVGPLVSTGADHGPDPDSPPYSLSYGGATCLADAARPNAGWVHEVAAGRSYVITANATVAHGRGESVTANVGRVAPGTYEIALGTVPDGANASEVRTPAGDCPVGTTVDLAANLPVGYERFDVTVDGRTVLTVENEDTAADLYRLPNPVGADGAANATE